MRAAWALLPLAVLAGLIRGSSPGEAAITRQALDALAARSASERYPSLVARIQATPVPAEGFTFVAVGDTRSNYPMALRVLTAAAGEQPAFILSNGDLVAHGRPEEFIDHHFRLLEAIRPVPFISVPGNHEEGPRHDFAAFKAVYGGDRFSFDYGGARFVGINDATFWGMSDDDLAYLDRELSRPGVEHRFVVFHVPPRELALYEEAGEGRGFRRNAEAMRRLFAARHVDCVFMGHVHGYAVRWLDGVRYIVTGGGGAPLTDRLGPEGDVYNYIVVHVRPGGVDYEAVRLVDDRWVRGDVAGGP